MGAHLYRAQVTYSWRFFQSKSNRSAVFLPLVYFFPSDYLIRQPFDLFFMLWDSFLYVAFSFSPINMAQPIHNMTPALCTNYGQQT